MSPVWNLLALFPLCDLWLSPPANPPLSSPLISSFQTHPLRYCPSDVKWTVQSTCLKQNFWSLALHSSSFPVFHISVSGGTTHRHAPAKNLGVTLNSFFTYLQLNPSTSCIPITLNGVSSTEALLPITLVQGAPQAQTSSSRMKKVFPWCGRIVKRLLFPTWINCSPSWVTAVFWPRCVPWVWHICSRVWAAAHCRVLVQATTPSHLVSFRPLPIPQASPCPLLFLYNLLNTSWWNRSLKNIYQVIWLFWLKSVFASLLCAA